MSILLKLAATGCALAVGWHLARTLAPRRMPYAAPRGITPAEARAVSIGAITVMILVGAIWI